MTKTNQKKNSEWEVKKLGDIDSITFLRGSGLKKSDVVVGGENKCILYGELYTKFHHPVIKDVVSRTNNTGVKLSQVGDVLVPATTTADAMGISIARALNEDGVIIGGDINILRTENKEVLADFLSYFINGPAKVKLASYVTGTNILHLSNKSIREIQITYPKSLAEQRRVVGILDKSFEAIENAKETAEKNLQNAKELFDRYSDDLYITLLEQYSASELSNLAKLVRGPFGGSLTKSMFVDSGYPVYEQRNAIGDFTNDFRYFIDEKKFQEMERFAVQSGDVIMSCSGTIGKFAFIEDNSPKGIINQALLKITPNEKKIDRKYLIFVLKKFIRDGSKHSVGVAIKNIVAVKELKKIQIPVPSLEQQKQIVKKLDELRCEVERLEAILRSKIADFEELKKSILQKAFSGEL